MMTKTLKILQKKTTPIYKLFEKIHKKNTQAKNQYFEISVKTPKQKTPVFKNFKENTNPEILTIKHLNDETHFLKIA